MMTKIKVNAEDLMLALESSDGMSLVWYIHRLTGGMIPVAEDDETALESLDDPLAQAYLKRPQDFIRIEPMRSHEAFVLMEQFISGLAEAADRERLEQVLRGKHPFRRFKDALTDAQRADWYRYKDTRLLAYATDWLRGNLPQAELSSNQPQRASA